MAIRHAETQHSLLRRSMETTTDAVDVSQDLHTLLCCAQQSVQRCAMSSCCGNGESDRQQHSNKIDRELRKLGASLGQAQHLAQTDLELCLQNVALSERLKTAASAQAMQLCLERRFAAVQRGAFWALKAGTMESCEQAEPEAEVAIDGPDPQHPQLQQLEDFISNTSNSTLMRLTAAVDQAGTLTRRLEDAVNRADKTLMRLTDAQQQRDQETVMTMLLMRTSQHLMCSCCRARK